MLYAVLVIVGLAILAALVVSGTVTKKQAVIAGVVAAAVLGVVAYQKSTGVNLGEGVFEATDAAVNPK